MEPAERHPIEVDLDRWFLLWDNGVIREGRPDNQQAIAPAHDRRRHGYPGPAEGSAGKWVLVGYEPFGFERRKYGCIDPLGEFDDLAPAGSGAVPGDHYRIIGILESSDGVVGISRNAPGPVTWVCT